MSSKVYLDRVQQSGSWESWRMDRHTFRIFTVILSYSTSLPICPMSALSFTLTETPVPEKPLVSCGSQPGTFLLTVAAQCNISSFMATLTKMERMIKEREAGIGGWRAASGHRFKTIKRRLTRDRHVQTADSGRGWRPSSLIVSTAAFSSIPCFKHIQIKYYAYYFVYFYCLFQNLGLFLGFYRL